MSDDASVAELLRLGWTHRGPTEESESGETAQWVIRIDELPGFLAVGQTREEALCDLQPALEAFLAELVAQKIAVPTPGAASTLVAGEVRAT